MSLATLFCFRLNEFSPVVFLLLYLTQILQAWLPDTSTKLKNPIEFPLESFRGNSSRSDHFTILYQDDDTLLLGGRNRIYNLSINNNQFSERRHSEIFWPSSEAHSQLCLLKGKSEDECQNYIRLLVKVAPGKLLVCGTNSFKPLCATFVWKNGHHHREPNTSDAKGLCPFDPDHNSTAIYSDGQLFSATVADFSGGDPLIFRDPQPLATELSDLKHLNAPNFVSSVAFGDYIYFFFRETAVEFMNCGKIIYSRVARVCKHDKGGGSHLSRNKWTTFSKARLNCSVPGEYPFYFDEIQSTSQIIDGTYGETRTKIIYGALTTPDNAIGGSAICLFQMSDIQKVFSGPFKHQETINSNWLPVPEIQVPEPRPGQCVNDSRLLPDATVNFIKTHPLMEEAVPAYFGRPILIRVSLNYRFTAIVVDPQVRTVNDRTYDVIYVGTDDGKVLKIVNVASETVPKALVISDNDVFAKGTPVTQLALGQGYGGVVAVSKNETKLVVLNHCKQITTCSECVELRDPHCAWDQIKNVCVSVDSVTNFRYLVQDVAKGSAAKCKLTEKEPGAKKVEYISSNSIDEDDDDSDTNLNELLIQTDDDSILDDCSDTNGDFSSACLKIKKSEFTSGTLWWGIIVAAMVGLLIGFVGGYCVSKKLYMNFSNTSCIEQRNHIDRLNVNQNSFLARPKNVNLDVLHMTQETLPPKKDNMGSLKNLNINEGTLQKIKKTYI
ncbi:semaphorin-1A-like [Anthonomus grandis grandis]|uniref:semaphorin-1A-like n=1 Tax=Anthonomus grandis grandis TaxID=2921223 RepID=UPI00216599BA|nr:semaphorin-1A-like [Anthonomus grandis grandis]XP_050313586.1 semaphorin-1A-like [Anthonomus grandis grandis]XP_050313587.1 semaphorin-1A-like [Anthonomus grandis grandis]